jgi:hypothetical protein
MVRPIFESYTPATASTTYFVSSVAGASFTLTNTATPDSLAHQVTITGLSATNLSAINATITGIGQDGNTQSETVALPNGAVTVTSTLYYKSSLTVTPASTTGASAVSIGYNNQFSSRTIPSNWRGSQAFVSVKVTGTINYTVQYTGDNIQGQPNTTAATRPYTWLQDDGTKIVASSTNGAETFSSEPMAYRFITNSYSAGATAAMTISEMNEQS